MRYPDGFAEYVVGATYATDDVVSDAAALVPRLRHTSVTRTWTSRME